MPPSSRFADSSGIRDVSHCRSCGSPLPEPFLCLGDMPLTGVFVKPSDPDPVRASLNLALCDECSLLQLAQSVDPELMYQAYWYRSGTNEMMRAHLADVATDAAAAVELNAGDRCLDIGCNDGTLLKAYPASLVRLGCDPSNAVQEIDDDSIDALNDFFSARAVREKWGDVKFKVITSISMFYDLDDPTSFVGDIEALLDDEGVWILEMNYTGNMVRDLGFDMISHEHVTYYTLISFAKLLERSGLRIAHVSENAINGGSIRVFCRKAATGAETSGNVADLVAREVALGLDSRSGYDELRRRMEVFRADVKGLVDDIVGKGQRIALYGASTRVNTPLLYCGLDVESIYCAAERSPGKYGLVTPGSRIPIRPEAEVREDDPEYMLIGPHFLLPSFLRRERDYLDRGGKFIVLLPELRVIGASGGELAEERISAYA